MAIQNTCTIASRTMKVAFAVARLNPVTILPIFSQGIYCITNRAERPRVLSGNTRSPNCLANAMTTPSVVTTATKHPAMKSALEHVVDAVTRGAATSASAVANA